MENTEKFAIKEIGKITLRVNSKIHNFLRAEGSAVTREELQEWCKTVGEDLELISNLTTLLIEDKLALNNKKFI